MSLVQYDAQTFYPAERTLTITSSMGHESIENKAIRNIPRVVIYILLQFSESFIYQANKGGLFISITIVCIYYVHYECMKKQMIYIMINDDTVTHIMQRNTSTLASQ